MFEVKLLCDEKIHYKLPPLPDHHICANKTSNLDSYKSIINLYNKMCKMYFADTFLLLGLVIQCCQIYN